LSLIDINQKQNAKKKNHFCNFNKNVLYLIYTVKTSVMHYYFKFDYSSEYWILHLGQIWTNPNVGLKMQLKKVKVWNYITFLTQHLGLSIF